jgi:hypothetical protein
MEYTDLEYSNVHFIFKRANFAITRLSPPFVFFHDSGLFNNVCIFLVLLTLLISVEVFPSKDSVTHVATDVRDGV